ncbi:hypothetical protein BST97_12405 [Nonlabens spongiae]|uniref:Glycosyltransferase RgtA/B/C/D-like domain-containing protein n=1 Tax=Nonlabens spongiae TaxID=331648 RepID=A0A1W6MMA4_9FLAO|nr:hypothetical protein [Nonlabens spongiae]ARN78730.1 hypothetical protein BST97_12405 [Nonlabens spongiae]
MLSRLQKNRPTIVSYLFLLGAIFTVFYLTSYNSKLSPIGDNAHYIILGNALAEGSGYVDVHEPMSAAHKHYPPGYPIFIAALNVLSFDQLDHYKIANGLLLLGSVFLCFILFAKVLKSRTKAVLVSILIAVNLHMLVYGSLVMSELLYVFCSFIVLWQFRNLELHQNKNCLLRILILSAISAICIYTRSIGISLVAGILALLLIRKQFKQAGFYTLGVILLYTPWWIRNKQLSDNSYTSQLLLKNPYQPELGNVKFTDLTERILINLERYILTELPAALLKTEEVFYTDLQYDVADYLIGITLAVIMIVGAIRVYKLFPVLVFYAIAYFSILLVWPIVWYGTRFIMPLIPVLLLFLVLGIFQSVQFFTRLLISSKSLKTSAAGAVVLICWICVYGFGSITYFNETSLRKIPANYLNFYNVAEWTKTNLKADDLIYTNKERIFHLHSGKKVMKINKIADQDLHLQYLIDHQVDYVVLEKLGFSSTTRYLKLLIDRYPEKFLETYKLESPDTYLFEFRPELGYTGDWNNDKREGYGIYVWQDGQRFEGYWKNNLRHGNGTVIFENGESLTGTWTEGSLNGIAVKKDQDGKVIERAFYEKNQKLKIVDEAP